MLWRRRRPGSGAGEGGQEGARAAPPLPTEAEARELEKALDAIAEMLRAFGRSAFDLPDQEAAVSAEQCEQWAQHLLVRAPRPTERGGAAKGSAVRDWSGMVRFFADLRQAEHGYLEKALADFRHAIWEFVNGLRNALSGEVESDAQVKQQLLRLKQAAEGSSTDVLRREAIAVTTTIAHLLEERRERQRTYSMELGERVAALGRQLEEARRDSAIDALTQLFNRRAFDEHIEKAAALGDLAEQPIALVVVDIDHFKRVNDSYGHPMGDEVLRRVAGRLAKTFLRRDDFLARLGGEEFAVILRDTRIDEAAAVSERLLRGVRALCFTHAGEAFGVTVSAGVAQFRPGEPLREWIERADRALYDAKRSGRDRVCVSRSAAPAPTKQHSPSGR